MVTMEICVEVVRANSSSFLSRREFLFHVQDAGIVVDQAGRIGFIGVYIVAREGR